MKNFLSRRKRENLFGRTEFVLLSFLPWRRDIQTNDTCQNGTQQNEEVCDSKTINKPRHSAECRSAG